MHHHHWITGILRGGPVAAALTWLVFMAAGYGPTGQDSPVGRVVFIVFVVAAALAAASGTYEHTRAATWLRAHSPRYRIDWDEFDAVRARWERRR